MLLWFIFHSPQNSNNNSATDTECVGNTDLLATDNQEASTHLVQIW